MASQIAEQILPSVQPIIDAQLELYRQPRTIQVVNGIPDTTSIPGSRLPHHWLRIPDVVCVFVDMKGSTQLSATLHDHSTAGVYQLFTGTAVRIFHAFDAPYIDVRGDGVFALFNQGQIYRAFAAAVTFKTFAHRDFAPTVEAQTGLVVDAHIGIDQKTVLVRKLGLNRHADRTDRQNEVWAGKPVNMASKLAAIGEVNELIVSDRYFAKIDHDLVRWSCGCEGGIYTGRREYLWKQKDLLHDPKFDFNLAHMLETIWCETHGREYCEAILALDRP